MDRQTDPPLLHLLNNIPHVYYNQAVELARRGSLTVARDKLLAAVTLEPEMLDAHVVLGKVYAQMGEYPEAISCWEAALKVTPDNTAARDGIAKAREIVNQLTTGRARKRCLKAAFSVMLFVLGCHSRRIGLYRCACPLHPP